MKTRNEGQVTILLNRILGEVERTAPHKISLACDSYERATQYADWMFAIAKGRQLNPLRQTKTSVSIGDTTIKMNSNKGTLRGAPNDEFWKLTTIWRK